jgi:hypothetical protein
MRKIQENPPSAVKELEMWPKSMGHHRRSNLHQLLVDEGTRLLQKKKAALV